MINGLTVDPEGYYVTYLDAQQRIEELEAECEKLHLMWENASHGQALNVHKIVELEQLLACEKTALDDEKAEHELTRAENHRLRKSLIEIREARGIFETNGLRRIARDALLEASQRVVDRMRGSGGINPDAADALNKLERVIENVQE